MNPVSHRARGTSASTPDEYGSSPSPRSFARHLYHDMAQDIDAAKLLPGEYYVATRDMMLVTVLGSCVAACIRDTRCGIGGMNHFMLPDSDASGPASESARYGSYAMEVLINHLLKLGASREHLEAKVFGGGNVLPGLALANVGHRNAAFVIDYLKTEQVRIVARDLADVYPRKVQYFPANGRVMVRRLMTAQVDQVLGTEGDYRRSLAQRQPLVGDVELFG